MFKERTECVLSHEKKWKPTRKSPSHVIIIPGDTFPVLSFHLRFLLPQVRERTKERKQTQENRPSKRARQHVLVKSCLLAVKKEEAHHMSPKYRIYVVLDRSPAACA